MTIRTLYQASHRNWNKMVLIHNINIPLYHNKPINSRQSVKSSWCLWRLCTGDKLPVTDVFSVTSSLGNADWGSDDKVTSGSENALESLEFWGHELTFKSRSQNGHLNRTWFLEIRKVWSLCMFSCWTTVGTIGAWCELHLYKHNIWCIPSIRYWKYKIYHTSWDVIWYVRVCYICIPNHSNINLLPVTSFKGEHAFQAPEGTHFSAGFVHNMPFSPVGFRVLE